MLLNITSGDPGGSVAQRDITPSTPVGSIPGSYGDDGSYSGNGSSGAVLSFSQGGEIMSKLGPDANGMYFNSVQEQMEFYAKNQVAGWNEIERSWGIMDSKKNVGIKDQILWVNRISNIMGVPYMINSSTGRANADVIPGGRFSPIPAHDPNYMSSVSPTAEGFLGPSYAYAADDSWNKSDVLNPYPVDTGTNIGSTVSRGIDRTFDAVDAVLVFGSRWGKWIMLAVVLTAFSKVFKSNVKLKVG